MTNSATGAGRATPGCVRGADDAGGLRADTDRMQTPRSTAAGNAPSIEVQNLSKRYGSVLALDDVTFSAASGRVTGFLGKNGSGKTTTMRALLGLTEPTSGTATFGGRRYVELANPIQQVGAVIANDSFHPSRTGRQHLRVMATAAGIGKRRVDEVLEQTGIASVADRRASGYSMGMRQRLALAGALLGDPAVLILDEPLNGLDPDGILWVRSLVHELAAEGRTVLLSSHLLTEVAASVDDIVVLANGRVVASQPLVDLTESARLAVLSPDEDALLAGLHTAGIDATRTPGGGLEVVGVSGETVGRVAASEGLVIAGLTELHEDLEHLFHELTETQEVMS